MSSEEAAAQLAWEKEMEMAIDVRARTRSRSIVGQSTDTNSLHTKDVEEGEDYTYDRQNSRRRGRREEDDDEEEADPLEQFRKLSLSSSRSLRNDKYSHENISTEEDDPDYLIQLSRKRSCSFTSLDKSRQQVEEEQQQQEEQQQEQQQKALNGEETPEELAKRAANLSKIYMMGSAPVDVSKLQDDSKIVGVKKVEVKKQKGALSRTALDALSEGLQLSMQTYPIGSNGTEEVTNPSEEELEEKKMEEEEQQKLEEVKQQATNNNHNTSHTYTNTNTNTSTIASSAASSARATLTSKASFLKSKVLQARAKLTASSSSSASGLSSSLSGGSSIATVNTTTSTSSSSRSSTSTTTSGSVPPAAPIVVTTAAAPSVVVATQTTTEDQTHCSSTKKKHKLKLLLLGDSGVGKTSLMRVFSGDEFSESMLATAGVDFKLRHISLDGENEIALQIWDTAGQERFHRITATYYKGANGIVLVYDVTDRKGFDNVGYWMNNIKQFSGSTIPAMLLVGNKTDLPNRTVSSQEGQATAAQYNCRFIETSAKTSYNTNGALETIARDAFLMSVTPTLTQKNLIEKDKATRGRRNKDNCIIS